ncbi:MAG TPA: sigma-70 family RNA polymerase sigma factor [bacterium]|nr:sigma-70 family RNA polymerase sigma factor [bacterium]
MAGGRVQGDDDGALLRSVAQGDVRAFETLYDRYAGPVYSLARGMLQDAQAAQEVAQDVFLGIWRGASAFDVERGSPRSWILSLAHHKSVDAVRRLRRHVAVPLSETMTDDADVVSEAIRKVESARVQVALGALSAEQRAALVLAYYGGYTQREIADRTGAPLGTVKTRMRDGLLRLRSALETAGKETVP